MLRNAVACVAHYLRCKSVDYALKETLSVRCIEVQVDPSRLFATALLRLANNTQERVWLFNQAKLLQKMRSRAQVSSSLLPLPEEAFEQAVDSLRRYADSEKSLCVQYVLDGLSRITLCAVQRYYQLNDIEQDNDDATVRRERWRARWSMSVSGDEKSALLMPPPEASIVPTYFTYSTLHGEVYWIPTLHTRDKGNRWPPNHRLKSVVRFATLQQLFDLTV